MEEAQEKGIIKIPIEDEVKQAYIDYSMSVIVQRALPDVRDGLKPVHRRILYAMDELHLNNSGPTRKCAKIVGDVLGKYHPHGDASVYDALVRLGQDFSQRYTLITPQGNFGTIAGDPAAAYRYTEAKMAKLAEEMVQDIDRDTVDMIANFDETAKEPTILPAKFPFLLCNGCSGIAVGMATNMPTHNLTEVANAICAYIDKMDITIEELMQYISGPDFPTGGIIFGKAGIKAAYTTGRGKIIVRAKAEIEATKGKESIVFTQVPYAVNTTNIIKKIKELAKNKVIDGISDVNDESSDRVGMRLVIGLKRGAVTKLVLNQLYSKTDLQTVFGVINLALVEGRPRVLNLKELIECFVKHRDNVVTRRVQFDLKKALARKHILEALIIAVDAIEEVIRIIRASEDTDSAKANLQKRFDFDSVQSQAIVDMQLKRLTHLQIDELRKEMQELVTLIAHLEDLLAHHEKILDVIKTETQELRDKYGDARRTEIVASEVEKLEVTDLIKEEDVVILLSKTGYIKRLATKLYKSQSRGGKGIMSASLIEGDYIKQVFTTSTHDTVMFFTTLGKAYCIKAHEIPEAAKTSRGTHIKSLLQLDSSEEVTATLIIKDFSDTQSVFMITKAGTVKRCLLSAFSNVKTRGIIAISLDDNDLLISAILVEENDKVFVVSQSGKALLFEVKDIRVMGRNGHGVRGMKLQENDSISCVINARDTVEVLLVTSQGYAKKIDVTKFIAHARGTQGQRCYGNTDAKGKVISCLAVTDNDEVLCMTSKGKTIRVQASAIRVQGVSASGVRMVALDSGDYIIGTSLITDEGESND